MKPGWTFLVRDEDYGDRPQVLIRYVDHDQREHVVSSLTLEVKERGIRVEPTLGGYDHDGALLDVQGFLQAALDAAWKRGLRPEGYENRMNELKAVRYHLEDMRALAKVPAR